MRLIKCIFIHIGTPGRQNHPCSISNNRGIFHAALTQWIRITCSLCLCGYAGAVKLNDLTKYHTQAELEEQLSTYFVNARDRKGGRAERLNRQRRRLQSELASPANEAVQQDD